VIVLVLLMLLVLPFFTSPTEDDTETAAVSMVHSASLTRLPGWEEQACGTLRKVLRSWPPDTFLTSGPSRPRRLVRLIVSPPPGPGPCADTNDPALYTGLREGILGNELVRVLAGGSGPVQTEVWFSHGPLERDEAVYSLLLTMFVLFVLVVGSLQVSSDAQRLVLKPIESLVEFLDRPATSLEADVTSKDNTGIFETRLVENTIKKLVTFLRAGFGPTGSVVAAAHLTRGNVSETPTSARRTLAGRIRRLASRGPPMAIRGLPGRRDDTTQQLATMARSVDARMRRMVDTDASPESLTLDTTVQGRSVRVITMRVRVAGAERAAAVLGDRWPALLNRMLRLVHTETVAWGGSPATSHADGCTCVWVIDDAWDAERQVLLLGQRPGAGSGLGYLEQRRASLGLPAARLPHDYMLLSTMGSSPAPAMPTSFTAARLQPVPEDEQAPKRIRRLVRAQQKGEAAPGSAACQAQVCAGSPQHGC